jgi:hypothetical protein
MQRPRGWERCLLQPPGRRAMHPPPSPRRYPAWGRGKYRGNCWLGCSFRLEGVRWSWGRCRSFAGLPRGAGRPSRWGHGKVKQQVGTARGRCGTRRHRPPRHGGRRGDKKPPAGERRWRNRGDRRDRAFWRYGRYRCLRSSGSGGCRVGGPGRSCGSARSARSARSQGCNRSQGRRWCGRRDGRHWPRRSLRWLGRCHWPDRGDRPDWGYGRNRCNRLDGCGRCNGFCGRRRSDGCHRF